MQTTRVHTSLGKSCLYGPCFVLKAIVILEHVWAHLNEDQWHTNHLIQLSEFNCVVTV